MRSKYRFPCRNRIFLTFRVYLEGKNHLRAEYFYREALSLFQAALPAGHANIGIAELQLGHVLVLERRYKDAEGPLLTGSDILTTQPGPHASRIAKARKDLVAVYDALHQPDLAAKIRAELVTNPTSQPEKSATR